MQTGIVAWFKASDGYGFIVPDAGGSDIFVHHTGILMDGYRKLDRGQRVEFETEIGPKDKPQAINVRIISQPEEVVRGASRASNQKNKF